MPAPFIAGSSSAVAHAEAQSSGRWSRTTVFFWLLLLLIVVVATYWIGRGGGFVFDDYPNIVDNKALHVSQLIWSDWLAAIFSSPASSLQRPLAMLSFAINHYFTGLDPAPMKLTNIAIHLVNALLVFALVRRLIRAAMPSADAGRVRRGEWAALFTAACWALHPINLMAVLFIVQRMESLCHVFVFAGLLLYVIGRQRQLEGQAGWWWILGGLVPCTALGLLAKESAVLLPLYALILECCLFHFRGRGGRRDHRLFAVFAVVLVLPGLLGLAWLLPGTLRSNIIVGRDFTLIERLLTEPRVVLDYLHWILFPRLGEFGLYHDDYLLSRGLLDPAMTIVGLLAMPLLLVIAWVCRRQRPLVSLGLLWFLAAQSLTATIIPLELVFEHRNYFASLGVCLMVTDVLLLAPDAQTPRRAGALFAVVFLGLCALTTHLRADEWSDPLRFASTEAARHPQSPRATYDFARTLIIISGYQTDSPLIPKIDAALAQAMHARNANTLPDQAALIFDNRIGRPSAAAIWQDMQKKLRTRAVGPQETGSLAALVDCSVTGRCQFPPDQMRDTFDAALAQGDNPEVLSIFGNYALNILGDSDLALRLWREAARLEPNGSERHISLAKLYIALGRLPEAREQIAQLRVIGRLGQYNSDADVLEARLQASLHRRDAPTGIPTDGSSK